MELGRGEKIIFEGLVKYGNRMVFTNRRLLIIDPSKVTSFRDLLQERDYVVFESNLEDIKEVYTKTSGSFFIMFSSMILELHNGKKFECYINAHGRYG